MIEQTVLHQELDPTQAECPHCGWVIQGREPEHMQKELTECRRKIREQQESGGLLPPGYWH